MYFKNKLSLKLFPKCFSYVEPATFLCNSMFMFDKKKFNCCVFYESICRLYFL